MDPDPRIQIKLYEKGSDPDPKMAATHIIRMLKTFNIFIKYRMICTIFEDIFVEKVF